MFRVRSLMPRLSRAQGPFSAGQQARQMMELVKPSKRSLVWRVLSPLSEEDIAGLRRLDELRLAMAGELTPGTSAAVRLAADLSQQMYTTESNGIEGSEYDLHQTISAVKQKEQSGSTSDYFDAIGHDNALGLLNKVCRGQTPLTAEYPQQLHALLLAAPEQRSKSVLPGVYRDYFNYRLASDGPVLYPPPESVAKSMEDLTTNMITFFNHVPDDTYRHPLVTSTLLHFNLVGVHPFGDGNGRAARLVGNTIMVRHGYQPVVIRSVSRQEYFAALSKADENNDILPLVQLCLREAILFHEAAAKLQSHCLQVCGEAQAEGPLGVIK